MEKDLNRQNNSGSAQEKSRAIRKGRGLILPEETREGLQEVLSVLGMSQKKLSKESGVSEALVSYLLKGTLPVRDPVRVSKLTDVLNLRLQQRVENHLIGEEAIQGVAEILGKVRSIYGMPSPEEDVKKIDMASSMRNYLSVIFEQNNLLGEAIKDNLTGSGFPGMQKQMSAALDMVNLFNQATETFLTKHGDIFLAPDKSIEVVQTQGLKQSEYASVKKKTT